MIVMKKVFTLLIALCSIIGARAQEYVDLGLSVNWATCNIGANSPEENGINFIGGTKDVYDSKTTRMKNLILPKHTQDYSGNPAYDAATAYWGDGWRTPTYAEWSELLASCSWQWYQYESGKGTIYGYRVIGPNGNSIILPARPKNSMSTFNSASYQCSTPHQSGKYLYVFYYFKEKKGLCKYKHNIKHDLLGQFPTRAVRDK